MEVRLTHTPRVPFSNRIQYLEYSYITPPNFPAQEFLNSGDPTSPAVSARRTLTSPYLPIEVLDTTIAAKGAVSGDPDIVHPQVFGTAVLIEVHILEMGFEFRAHEVVLSAWHRKTGPG